MIIEWGHYALFLALALSLVQIIIPLTPYWQLSRYTALGQCFFVSVSFISLINAFLQNDFSVLYVTLHSHTQLPWIYRFCAVWGAHEGSLLLWVFILSGWMGAVALFSHRLPQKFVSGILAVLGFIAFGFYAFVLTLSDPFTRLLKTPLNGQDLNPLLQDPGLVSHPPLLYMGYVGFSVTFAFAIAALLNRRLDAEWAGWVRPWAITAWCFLTIGIVLGSWWAYRMLGWGGFWFWDPVENASFLPWLVGTALIHSLKVTEKRNIFKAWTVLLCVLTFSLSLLGTFLVRSGVLISVHAFAVDPKRGAYILTFLSVVVGGSFLVYALRGRSLIHSLSLNFWSKEMLIFMNNIILFVSMLTVLLGTLYPLIISGLDLGIISVGAPYFNFVFKPLMIPLLFLMGLAPLVNWQNTDIRPLIKSTLLIFLISLVLSFSIPWLLTSPWDGDAVWGMTLVFWILINAFRRFNRRRWSMILSHAGVAITTIGIVLSTAYSEQRDLVMNIHERARIGPYEFQLENVMGLKGPNYEGARATVWVYNQHHLYRVLYPEQRIYTVSQNILPKTAIDAGFSRDLYVALGRPVRTDQWEMRIHYKPFVRWIWMGGLLMALGGFVTLWTSRVKKHG